MTSAPAGWYVDPEVNGGERWWDGTQWTEQRRPAAWALAQRQMAPPAPVQQATSPGAGQPTITTTPPEHIPGYAPPPQSMGNNSSVIGLVGGILSVVVGLGSIVAAANGTPPSLPVVFVIGAIIGGIYGLRRATQIQRTTPGGRPAGRARSIWALSLGGVGAIFMVIALGVAVGPHAPEFDRDSAQASIKKWLVGEQQLDVDRVWCPESPSLTEGNSFSCLAYSSGKVTHEVRVEVEDNAGSVIYTLDP